MCQFEPASISQGIQMASLCLGVYLAGVVAGASLRISSFLWILALALVVGVVFATLNHPAPLTNIAMALVLAGVAQVGYVSGIAVRAGFAALARPDSRLGKRQGSQAPPDS
jgi:hypothetical protein